MQRVPSLLVGYTPQPARAELVDRLDTRHIELAMADDIDQLATQLRPGGIRLVVTDLLMGCLTGLSLLRVLQTTRGISVEIRQLPSRPEALDALADHIALLVDPQPPRAPVATVPAVGQVHTLVPRLHSREA